MKGTDRIKREVLESMDWTEGHSDCRIGRVEKSKPEAERSRDMAEKMGKAEDLTGTRLKAGQGDGDCIFETRDVDYVTGKLGDIGKMACLSGGPRQRGAEKGVGKGFMIGEKGEFSSFKEKTEMADRGIG